jgi:hypothetical protein
VNPLGSVPNSQLNFIPDSHWYNPPLLKKILAPVMVMPLMTASVSLRLDTIELDDKLRGGVSLWNFR